METLTNKIGGNNMVNKLELDSLIERLKRDDNDHEQDLGGYLKLLIEENRLDNDAAIGSAKKAVEEGIYSLSKAQLRAIALEMLNKGEYIESCPNEWCREKIDWSDMDFTLFHGQCSHCNYQQEKIEAE